MTATAPAPALHIPTPAWVPVVTWLCLVGLAATLGALAYRRWRRHRRPKVTDREASQRRWLTWVAARWSWDAQNLGLVLVDDTTRHRRQPLTGQTLPPIVRVPQARFSHQENQAQRVPERHHRAEHFCKYLNYIELRNVIELP